MSLTDLPTEILCQICYHLPGSSDLLRLGLVCHRLRGVVEGLLYRAIEVRHLRNTTCLIRTLLERPALGSQVITLSTSQKDVRLFDDFEFRCSTLRKLLRLLPSLAKLSSSPPPPHLDLSANLSLKYLRLDFDFYNPPNGFGEDELQLVERQFWYPTLRTLQVDWINWDTSFDAVAQGLFAHERAGTSMITDLDLRTFSSMDQDERVCALHAVLRSVKALERFTFESSVDDVIAHMITRWYSLDLIVEALEPHVNSLLELVIAGSCSASFSRTLNSCSNITQFTRLKRLGILETFLISQKDQDYWILPPSVEELQLQNQWFDHKGKDWPLQRKRLETLIQTKTTGLLKALQYVVWWTQKPEAWSYDYTWRPEFVTEKESLVARFKEVGVKFDTSNESHFEKTPFAKMIQAEKWNWNWMDSAVSD